MKKIIILALTAILLLSVITGCRTTKEEPTEKTFTLSNMSITLPAEFEEVTNSSYLQVKSENYNIRIIPVKLSDITPKEGYEFPTLEDFITISGMVGDIEESDIKEENGLKVVDYDSDNDEQPDRFFVLFETDDAYWTVAFTHADTIDHQTARAQCMEWVKTITFSTAEATE